MFKKIETRMTNLQTYITDQLSQTLKQNFREDVWNYESGEGGGITRIFSGGIIQKGGVNFSGVKGILNEKISENMKLPPGTKFKATGLSIVLHAENPYVPTIHMNIRYFETAERQWFGGGIDLTPNYPFEEDIRFFHKILKDRCDIYREDAYQEYKAWCDRYFFIKHRNEMRGVGGIFFDYLQGDFRRIEEFIFSAGEDFTAIYLPIAEKRKDLPYGERQKKFQQIRRGRYVEFNLVYDRGTLFGLETGGRIESILMSLPETAGWDYQWIPPTEEETRINLYLQPIDWF